MPVPPPDTTETPDAATPTGRLIGLVRKLIDYGKQLVITLRQPATAADIEDATLTFGTLDIRQIIASITRGLHRAAALEARLSRRAARELTAQTATASTSVRAPRATRTAERSPKPEADPRLARMPTPAEIAAAVRRRPIGAVIADICFDLGIMPSSPLWREISLAIIIHNGNLAPLFSNIFKRIRTMATGTPAPLPAVRPPPSLRPTLVPGTGPP
jgi:hypothetical protein